MTCEYPAIRDCKTQGCAYGLVNFKSNRVIDWEIFSEKVIKHIEGYTVPQYGDRPVDQIEDWSVEDCLRAVKKRLSRFGRNSRPGQDELDLLKMVHEIQIAFDKYSKQEQQKVDNDILTYNSPLS